MSNDPTKNPLEEMMKGLGHDIRNLDVRMNERFSGIDERLSGIDERLSGIDEKLSGMDQRLSGVEERLSGVEGRLSGVEVWLTGLDEKVSVIDGRLDGLGARLFSLEDRVDRRLKETRPIWEAVQAQLADLNSFVHKLDDKIDLQNRTIGDLYSNQRKAERRLDKLER